MSREELLVLFSTLSNESEEPPPVTDIVNSIKSHKAEVADSNLVTLQNIENELNIDDAMSESMIRDILWSKENRNEPNEPQNINSDSNDDRYELGGDGDPIFDADETSELNQHIDELQYDRTPSQQSLTQDQEHKIVVFCSITGSETEYAKIMLEVHQTTLMQHELFVSADFIEMIGICMGCGHCGLIISRWKLSTFYYPSC